MEAIKVPILARRCLTSGRIDALWPESNAAARFATLLTAHAMPIGCNQMTRDDKRLADPRR
jgi:hypothetical protein